MSEPIVGKILNPDPTITLGQPLATGGCVFPPAGQPRNIPQYAWRPYNMTLREDGTRIENSFHVSNIELNRQKVIDFLDGEARQGYRLVQMATGPYWLFEKL